jgi:hypothetical protein
MDQPARRGLRTGLTVLAAIGLLAVIGRLWSAGLVPPTASPGGAAIATVRPLPAGIEFAQPISALAVTRAAVWIAHGTTIERMDPRTLRVTGSLQVPSSLRVPGVLAVSIEWPIRGLAASAGGEAIWASLPSGLLRIDTASGRIVAVVPVAGVGPPAVSDSAVWVVCCGGETSLGAPGLTRVDPATNRVVAQVPLPGLPDAVGVGASGVWVRGAAGPVWRVDPATNRVVATVRVPHGLGGGQGSVAVGRDAVWVSDPASETALRIDPRRDRITGQVEVFGRALAAAANGTVVATGRGRLLRLEPGSVRGVDVDGINGEYVTALGALAGTIWVAAETGVVLHVDHQAWR